MHPMTGPEARYDGIAEGYAAWWAPVHRPATLALLDEVARAVDAGARRILDVGTGTGTLATAAVRRWAGVEVDAVDASEGMLEIARREAAGLPGPAASRLRLHRATAERLPFGDGTFDLVVSAFVLQLVPSRFRALREARRVLRPGGRLAYVSWLAGGEPFAADAAYDEALLEAGLEPREAGPGPDDVPSPGAAVAQLRRAGFSEAAARPDVLEHPFTPEGYLGFVSRFDDEDLFASLDGAARQALETGLLGRLRAMPAGRLTMRLPVVYATGRRSGA